MNNRRLNIYLLAIPCFCNLFLPPLFAHTDQIETIRNLFYSINQLIEGKRVKEILVYTDGDGYSKNKWYRFKETCNKNIFNQYYFKAINYLYEGKVIKTIIIIDSQVGDWTNTKEHYFYENGNIAFIFEKHVTSQAHNTETGEDLPPGPYIIEKRRYFDENGKQIKALEKAFISSNEKIIPVKFVRQIDFSVDVYRNISALPFSQILIE